MTIKRAASLGGKTAKSHSKIYKVMRFFTPDLYLRSIRPIVRRLKKFMKIEFDVRPDGTLQHEVLLSNGHILTLRFYELRLLGHEFETSAVAKRA